MAASVVIEHNNSGWLEIFTSAEMQAVVDEAGERIAAEAGDGFEYSQGTHNRVTVAGFVNAATIEAMTAEAVDKSLTKAVHL